MRTHLAVALLLAGLCSCRGGAGAGGASANLNATHPNLLGAWQGLLQSDRGPQASLSATIQADAGDASRFLADLNLSLISGVLCYSRLSGTVRAGGSTVTVAMQAYDDAFIDVRAQIVEDGLLRGTYSVRGGLCDGDRGTIELRRRASSPVVLYEFDCPDLLLLVEVREHR